jgi:phosphate starvation-inducible PhoH-like protein
LLFVEQGDALKTKRQTRRQRLEQEKVQAATLHAQAVAEYVSEPKPQAIPRLEPKNQKQVEALYYLENDYPVVICQGSAGTGKSLLLAYRAAKLLKSKKIDKVYLVRPAVGVGRTVGLLPGELEQKLAPYFAQTITHLEKFLGKGYTKYCLDKKIIEMKAVEFLRGTDFTDCLVLCEETQDFTKEEFEMMLTRISTNCQMAFTGDIKQHDLRGISGLETTVKLLNKMIDTAPDYMLDEDLENMENGIGIVEFGVDDVLRSDITRAFVRMFHYN